MADLLHKRGVENLIPASNRQALVGYAERIMEELPEGCANCPAAYLCAVALNEDNGYGFPRTPNDVRDMKIKHGSGYGMLSGQAQFALKGIVSDANDKEAAQAGPSSDGKKCCLDSDTEIDINKSDPYGW